MDQMQFFTLLLSFLLVPSFDSLGLLATSPGSFWCNRHCNGNSHRGFEPIFYPFPHTVPFYYSDLCYFLSLTLSRTALFYSVTKSLAYSPPVTFPSLFRSAGQRSTDPSLLIKWIFYLCSWPEDPFFNGPRIIPSNKDPPQQKTAITPLCCIFYIFSGLGMMVSWWGVHFPAFLVDYGSLLWPFKRTHPFSVSILAITWVTKKLSPWVNMVSLKVRKK